MRQMKLGIHTYTLHLNGLGQNWGFKGEYFPKRINLMQLMDLAVEWGLDGLHITGCDLETKDDARLEEVAKAAKERGLYLEYNFSVDEEFDLRLNDRFENAAYVAYKLGAEIAKVSLDIRRESPIVGSRMCPHVMRQLIKIRDDIVASLPIIEKYGITFALENHTEIFIDELLWLVNQVNHPLVRVCLDTINSLDVCESLDDAVNRLAPYAVCVHFCDNKIVRDHHGFHFIGVALGEGDVNCQGYIDTIRKYAPTDRINFEVEWDLGDDTLKIAQEKEVEACIKSIKYLRDILKIGREEEIPGIYATEIFN